MKRKAFSLWVQRGYLPWLVADTGLTIAGYTNAFVLPLLLFMETGSPAQAGAIASLRFVIDGLCHLFGGWVQDRYDRRKITFWFSLSGAFIYGLAVALLVTGHFNLVPAALLSIALGVRAGFCFGITNIMLRSFLPASVLPKAIAVNEGRDSVIEFGVGPVAGLLLQIGRAIPYVLNVVVCLMAALASRLLPVSISDPTSEGEKETPFSFRELTLGFQIILKQPFLRASVFFGNPAFAFFNAVTLITVIHVVDVRGSAAMGGVVNAAVAGGVFLGSLIAARLTNIVSGAFLYLAGFGLQAASILVLATVDSPLGIVCALLPSLILLPAGNACGGSLEMLIVADHHLGRLFAAYAVVGSILSAAVTAFVSFLYERVGYDPTVLICGSAISVLTLIMAGVKEIRSIPTADRYEEFAKQIAVNRESN